MFFAGNVLIDKLHIFCGLFCPLEEPFVRYLTENPDWLVLDIGAQIGQYSLFAARLGRDVLTVEPFVDNVRRIHKAAQTDSLSERITLVTNALSDRRNEIKLLARNADNIGGQSLLDNEVHTFAMRDMLTNKYLVETILMDDLVDRLPRRRSDGGRDEPYTKAIMKIDIEGFEPYAFQYSRRLFALLDFQVVFMEWGRLARHSHLRTHVREMLHLLYGQNLLAYARDSISGLELLLDANKPHDWPWDIYWKKSNL